MQQSVLFEKNNGVAVITFNRPERRNAINQEVLKQFYNCIDEVAANNDIRVGIITGNGKSFSSGIDLAAFATDNLMDPRGDGKDFPDVIANCKKPVIGAVNGHAINAGFEIALNCDFLIASRNAVFLDTHAKMKIHPGWGMSQLLRDSVGKRMAKQISLSCQNVSADEAFRMGLVNEVVDPENLLTRTMEIAANIAKIDPVFLQVMKDLIEHQDESPVGASYRHERKNFMKLYEEHLKSG